MMTNVMVKTCLSQKIIKNRNLIQAMKNSVYPKVLKRKLSESRIFRKAEFVRIFVRIFTECSEGWIEDVDWRHDMIIVNWGEVTLIQFFRKPNLFEFVRIYIYRMFRRVNWTHDMIIVKWHLFIWQVRKLCALTNAPPVQSTQTGQWLSTILYANCSAAHVYVLYPRQFIFALSCRRRSFLQVLQSTER